MPINRLYRSLRDLLIQLRPNERQTRTRNFSWLLVGLLLSRSVHLSKIANKVPTTKATLPSAVRRLSRLVDNTAIGVREWYEPLARRLLECQAQSLGEVRLIVDASKVGFKHRLLMVGLAYRKRTLPVAWSWVRSEKGHSSAYKQRALLDYVPTFRTPPVKKRIIIASERESAFFRAFRGSNGPWGSRFELPIDIEPITIIADGARVSRKMAPIG